MEFKITIFTFVRITYNQMNTKLEELKAKVAEIQKEIEKLEEEESKYLDLSANCNWSLGDNWEFSGLSKYDIQVKIGGEYNNKGFYLSEDYNWEIAIDSEKALVLLPTKKII